MVWSPKSGASLAKNVAGTPCDEYTLDTLVARGTCASIWRASDNAGGDAVAIKCISAKRVQREFIDVEIETLRLCCSDPNVVSLIEVVHAGNWTCLVMPLATGHSCGPDLEQALSSCGGFFPDGTARECFRQIAQAVAHCHARGVSHGDLKMENVLVQARTGQDPDPLLSLCDFGCATSKGQRYDIVGTAHYVAPEAVQEAGTREGSRAMGYDGHAADVFSAGVLLYTMLAGHFPFARPPLSALNSDATRDTVKTAYMSCDSSALQFPPSVSQDAVSLVRSMLQRDPMDRPSAAAILDNAWLAQRVPTAQQTCPEGVPPVVVHAEPEPEPEPVPLPPTAKPPCGLRRQTERQTERNCFVEETVERYLCSPSPSPQPEEVVVRGEGVAGTTRSAAGGVARCACCGLMRPRTLSLPVRMAPMVPRICREANPFGDKGSDDCGVPCC